MPSSMNSESHEPEEKSPGGLNLTLIYSLIGAALIAAILIAALIVLPFYRRH